MAHFLPRHLKLALIFSLFSCVSHLAYAASPPTLTGTNAFLYKLGQKGPGGGFIFFVDYEDQSY